jgi:hypothetical protein
MTRHLGCVLASDSKSTGCCCAREPCSAPPTYAPTPHLCDASPQVPAPHQVAGLSQRQVQGSQQHQACSTVQAVSEAAVGSELRQCYPLLLRESSASGWRYHKWSAAPALPQLGKPTDQACMPRVASPRARPTGPAHTLSSAMAASISSPAVTQFKPLHCSRLHQQNPSPGAPTTRASWVLHTLVKSPCSHSRGSPSKAATARAGAANLQDDGPVTNHEYRCTQPAVHMSLDVSLMSIGMNVLLKLPHGHLGCEPQGAHLSTLLGACTDVCWATCSPHDREVLERQRH